MAAQDHKKAAAIDGTIAAANVGAAVANHKVGIKRFHHANEHAEEAGRRMDKANATGGSQFEQRVRGIARFHNLSAAAAHHNAGTALLNQGKAHITARNIHGGMAVVGAGLAAHSIHKARVENRGRAVNKHPNA